MVDVSDLFEQANQTDQLRAALRQRATNVISRARRRDARASGSVNTFAMQDQVRRDGRFVVNIQAHPAGEGRGASPAAVRRTLRQAMGGRS